MLEDGGNYVFLRSAHIMFFCLLLNRPWDIKAKQQSTNYKISILEILI